MFTNELKSLIKGEVETDEATLIKYSHDASLLEVKPQAVVFPKNSEDVQKLVRWVNEKIKQREKISLTPRSGGTDMSGGAIGESIVLDFTRHMNAIRKVSADGYAIVEPGVFYRDLEKATLQKNLFLPSYPASREICAIGGMVGNNSGGEKTLAYGKTEDYVEELKAVLADGQEYRIAPLTKETLDQKMRQSNFEGELYQKIYQLTTDNQQLLQRAKPKVSKNSAGYALWNIWDGRQFQLQKIFVGSQGTLGIITEIKFRLINPKPHRQMAVIFLKDLKRLVKTVQLVMQFRPESFELFDDHTLKLALKFFPQIIKIMKPRNILRLLLGFIPEALMVLRMRQLPKLILLAEFTDYEPALLDRRLKNLRQNLTSLGVPFRILRHEEEQKKYWAIRRESFNLLRQRIKGKRTAPFIDDFIVRPEQLGEFLPELNRLLDQYDLTYTMAGHAGDANFHIIPLVDPRDPRLPEIIKKLSEEVYDLVLKYHGSITAEHNDGLIRSPYLKKMYGEKVYQLFEETKKIFDPLNIFNPGKKVGADLQYTLDHLNRS